MGDDVEQGFFSDLRLQLGQLSKGKDGRLYFPHSDNNSSDCYFRQDLGKSKAKVFFDDPGPSVKMREILKSTACDLAATRARADFEISEKFSSRTNGITYKSKRPDVGTMDGVIIENWITVSAPKENKELLSFKLRGETPCVDFLAKWPDVYASEQCAQDYADQRVERKIIAILEGKEIDKK